MTLKTPLGEEIHKEDLEKLDRVECPVCRLAVLKDELTAEGKCLFCILDEYKHGW